MGVGIKGEVVAPVGVGRWSMPAESFGFSQTSLWTVSLSPDGSEAENLDGHQGVLLNRGAC